MMRDIVCFKPVDYFIVRDRDLPFVFSLASFKEAYNFMVARYQDRFCACDDPFILNFDFDFHGNIDFSNLWISDDFFLRLYYNLDLCQYCVCFYPNLK